MESQIRKALEEVDQGRFINLHLPAETYDDIKGQKLACWLNAKNRQIIYITSKTPSEKLGKKMSRRLRESVFFVDMVGGSGSVFSREGENTLYTATETSLTELGISVFSLERFRKKDKLIVLDSIPSLIEKNGIESVTSFLRFLKGRIESGRDCGLLLSLCDNEGIPASLIGEKFFHKTLKIRD